MQQRILPIHAEPTYLLYVTGPKCTAFCLKIKFTSTKHWTPLHGRINKLHRTQKHGLEWTCHLIRS